MSVVIIVLMGLFVVGILFQQVSRAPARIKGTDHCKFCRAKLKKTQDRRGYASTCSRCGKEQV